MSSFVGYFQNKNADRLNMDFKDLKAAISEDVLRDFCDSLNNATSNSVFTIGKLLLFVVLFIIKFFSFKLLRLLRI